MTPMHVSLYSLEPSEADPEDMHTHTLDPGPGRGLHPGTACSKLFPVLSKVQGSMCHCQDSQSCVVYAPLRSEDAEAAFRILQLRLCATLKPRKTTRMEACYVRAYCEALREEQ